MKNVLGWEKALISTSRLYYFLTAFHGAFQVFATTLCIKKMNFSAKMLFWTSNHSNAIHYLRFLTKYSKKSSSRGYWTVCQCAKVYIWGSERTLRPISRMAPAFSNSTKNYNFFYRLQGLHLNDIQERTMNHHHLL